jgi:hypothetical protein
MGRDEVIIEKIKALAECDDVRPVIGFNGYYTTPNGDVWSIMRGAPHRLKPWAFSGRQAVNLTNDNGYPVKLTLLRVVALALLRSILCTV